MEEDKRGNLNSFYPEITFETGDIIMKMAVKKDYNHIEYLMSEKNELIIKL